MKKLKQLTRLLGVLAVIMAFLGTQEVWGATYYSIADGNWSDNTTWDATGHGGAGPAGPPVAGDIVYIGNHTVTLTVGAAAASVEIDHAGGDIDLGTFTLTLSGNFVNTSGTGTVIDGTGAGAALVVGGNFSSAAAGTFDFTSGALTVTGNVALTLGTLNLTTATASIGGNITNAGTITLTGATATITGTITNTGTFTTSNATVLTLNGTADVSLPAITDLDDLTVNKTSGGNVYAPTGGDLTIAGTLLISNGIYNVASGRTTTVTTALTMSSVAGVELKVGSGTLLIGDAATFGALSTLTTTANSSLTIGDATGTTAVTLPDEVTTLKTLTINKGAAANDVYLTSDLILSNSGGNVLVVTQGQLQPVAGNTVDIVIETGDVSVAANGAVCYRNLTSSTGEINFFFGGENSGGSSTVTLAVDAAGTAGLNINDLTIEDASVEFAGDYDLELYGNLSLIGTSSFIPVNTGNGTFTFTGGAAQTMTVGDDSYLEFVNLSLATASTAVTTSDNFTVREILTIAASTSLIASGGTFTLNPPAGATADIDNSGTLTLYDVLINTSGAAITTTGALFALTVNGDFTKIGSNNLDLDDALTGGTITFTNTNLAGKELQLVGGTNTLFNLTVSAGSKLKTSSDFGINSDDAGALTLGASATFIAEAGTITFGGGTAASIVNPSTGTLEFNNLTIGAATATSSSFTIKGNLTTSAALTASGGTVTFTNDLPKTINNTSTSQLNNLVVSNGSRVVTGTLLTVIGNFTVGTDAAFTATAAAITFGGGTTKTITNNDSLVFFNLVVADVASNAVVTTSDFIIAGTDLTLSGAANGTFTASTPSTITMTGDVILTAPSASRLTFYNVYLNGSDVDVTLAAGDYVYFTGDLTINGAGSSFVSASDAFVTFSGTTGSVIGEGTSTPTSPAATFGRLIINKTGTSGNDEVLMETDVTIASAAGTTITLTDGVLNLGSKTLTVGANTLPTQTDGVINGGTGTYVISTGHAATGLIDDFFEVDGEPTLYNLDVLVAHTMGAGDLTVNGDFDFTGGVIFTIPASQTLEIKGDVITTAAGTFVGGAVATSVLKLTGLGTCDDLSNSLFGATYPSLTIERGETLAGNLALQNNNILIINSGTQFLDLNGYDLDLDAGTGIQLLRESGGLDAEDTGSGVILNSHSSMTTIVANLFKNNKVYDLTLANTTDYTLGGDLEVTHTLAYVGGAGNEADIYTNNNTLTFSEGATIPAFNDADHIIGNVQMTVTSTLTTFFVGDGTANGYRPLSLKFATSGSEQVVKVSSQKINPTYGRGGNPQRAVNVLWTITPSGTAPTDTLWADFGWGSDYDNGLTVAATTSFPAKWNSTSWTDYRNGYGQIASATGFTSASELSPLASNYPISASALSGNWAVFVAAGNTTTDKDNAVKVTNAKLGITSISPNPIGAGLPFKVTIQLQDQYGNPTINHGTSALQIGFTDVIGTITAPAASIAVGSSSTVVNGFIYAAAGAGKQFKAYKTSGGPTYTIDTTVSPLVYVLNTLPSDQIIDLVLGGGQTSTTLAFDIANNGTGIIIAKSGSAITSSDFPVDGTTYYGSTVYGQGSTINDAVVVYAGSVLAAGNTITVTGLAPNTTYYFRGFAYNGSNGNEKYLTFSAAGNPKNFTTTGGIDDDAVYGNNDSMSVAKPIGTNTDLIGTIKSETDEDWFSFSVTNGSPNLRTKLTLSALMGNYNIEVYNLDERRVRRGTRLNNSNEAQVINDLTPGTYVVRIYGVSGAYSTTLPYTLLLTTKGSEIYSVTE